MEALEEEALAGPPRSRALAAPQEPGQEALTEESQRGAQGRAERPKVARRRLRRWHRREAGKARPRGQRGLQQRGNDGTPRCFGEGG